ncbi:MAG: hypothetical protein RJA87_1143 [Pseudomonadota bacterium]|jgi:hypothetical protein
MGDRPKGNRGPTASKPEEGGTNYQRVSDDWNKTAFFRTQDPTGLSE